MADPLTEMAKQVGKTVLERAVQSAKAYIAEAERARRNTAEACVAYLRAANAALDGLMGEYDAILTEAGTCDLSDSTQRQHLRARIATYLREYSLTEVLRDAAPPSVRAQQAEHSRRARPSQCRVRVAGTRHARGSWWVRGPALDRTRDGYR